MYLIFSSIVKEEYDNLYNRSNMLRIWRIVRVSFLAYININAKARFGVWIIPLHIETPDLPMIFGWLYYNVKSAFTSSYEMPDPLY